MPHEVKRISRGRDWQLCHEALHSPPVTCRGYCRAAGVFLCGSPCHHHRRARLGSSQPTHLQEPSVQQQCHDKTPSIRWGGSTPSRTVTAQSQGMENSTGFYSESLGRVSAPGRGSSPSCTHMHAHTGHLWWCSWLAITLTLPQTKSRLASSPPYSDGSKGWFKETLPSKIFYKDRFLCISNQSSKSRHQFRQPSAAQGVKKKK